jgi:peptidyl-prolyl cis-trans isomerase SurA
MLRSLMRRTAFPLLAIASLSLSARAETVERIAAIVNGRPITLSEVTERVAPELAHAPAGPAGEAQRQQALKQGLNQLIDEHLVASEASSLGLEITDDEVAKAFEQLAKQNGMEAKQFQEALTQQGISVDNVKESLKRQQLMMRLLQYKVKPRKVSDEEVQRAYATRNKDVEYEVRARDLYIAVPEHGTPEQEAAAKQKVEAALRRLKSGESFAKVARDLSDGPSAGEGGDLGYIRRGSMIPAFEQAAFALQPGQTSKVLRLASGYHLIKVEDRRKVQEKPLADVQEEIRSQLASESVLTERDHYMQQLRKTAQIDEKL